MRRSFGACSLLAACAALLSACVTPALPSPNLSAPRTPFEAHITELMTHAQVFKPEGDGPFPTVVMFHGCGNGRPPSQQTWAEVIRDAGWAAVVVDSYSSRDISRLEAATLVCGGFKFWGRERAGDVFAAVAWTRQQPWADGSRIVAAGWSHGGWSVLDAMAIPRGEYAEAATRLSGLPAEPLEGVVGVFVSYPYLGLGSVARENGVLLYDARPLAIVATADTVVGSRSVQRTLERLTTPGAPIRVERFEGATHAFDMPEVRDLRVRYSAEHTERAHALLVDYLRSIPPAGAAD